MKNEAGGRPNGIAGVRSRGTRSSGECRSGRFRAARHLHPASGEPVTSNQPDGSQLRHGGEFRGVEEGE